MTRPSSILSTKKMMEDKSSIETLLKNYGTALSSSNTHAILDLFGLDPVVVPQNSPPVVGRDEVSKFLNHSFRTFKFDYQVTIDELEVSGDLAWARTSAINRTRILSSGKEIEVGVNQHWIFRRGGGGWKIHLYSFAANSPPPSS